VEEAAAVMSVARPAFSVIVPAYNAEATIDATLGSIAGQTREDLRSWS
jgi:glycosyltransferase involved in cell wall biosynthesis